MTGESIFPLDWTNHRVPVPRIGQRVRVHTNDGDAVVVVKRHVAVRYSLDRLGKKVRYYLGILYDHDGVEDRNALPNEVREIVEEDEE